MKTKLLDPGGSHHNITPLAKHHSSDDAAHDEPKTYCHEQDDPLQDTLHSELESVKVDLVQQGEDGQSSYGGGNNGRKATPGYNHSNLNPLINSTLPTSNLPSLPEFGRTTTYPYSPFHPHINPQYSIQQTTSQPTSECKVLAGMTAQQMYYLPGHLSEIPNPLTPWNPTTNSYATSIAVSMSQHLRMNPFTSAGTGLPNFPAMLNQEHLNTGMLPHPTTFSLQMPEGHRLPQNVQKSANIMEKMLQQHQGGVGGNNPIPHHSGHHGNHQLIHMVHNSGGLNSAHGNHHVSSNKNKEKSEKPDRSYVKKPPNAFMLYMQEQRQKVVAECTTSIKSSAINQILGRKWKNLGREEKQIYCDKADKARKLHMEKFPGWSASDNYRKRKKKEKPDDSKAGPPKKCRAVYGLDSKNLWCAPCRSKKKCVRYRDEDSGIDDSSPMNQSSPGLPPQSMPQG